LAKGVAEQVIERSRVRLDEGSDALRVLGVRHSIKEAIRCAQNRDSDFGPVDEWGKSFMVTLAGLAKEDGPNAAPRTQGFFDQTDAFYSNEAGLGWQPSPEGQSKLFEPAIVPAGQDASLSGLGCSSAPRTLHPFFS
jgi:hypothetical protein